MAFSATVRNTQYCGPGKTIVTGSWSGSSGDTAGLFTVSGVVTASRFQKFDSDNTYQGDARCSTSTASGLTTITVNNQDDVTTGYFTVEKLG
jgi:hypothetical protein